MKRGNYPPVRYRAPHPGARKLEHLLGEEPIFALRRKEDEERKRLERVELRRIVTDRD